MTSRFTVVTVVPAARAEIFGISLDIDAHVASMSQSGERAVGGVTAGRIALGETVTWRARHFGIWFTMTSQITELDEPERFVDRQVSGPFKVFEHEHRFDVTAAGTRMADVITVASPIFGVLADRLVLVPYLRHLIAKRNRHLVAALAGTSRG